MAYDDYFSTRKLLLHCDGTNGSQTFTDVLGKTITANGNAQISTAQSKFGGASAYFDGTGDYLTLADSADWDLPGDFTVETWVYLAAYSPSYSGSYGVALVANFKGGAAGIDWGWQIRINGTSNSFTEVDVYTGLTDLIFSHTFNLDTWYHIAVCRASGVIRVFADGVKIGVDKNNTDAFTKATSDMLYIGTLNDATYKFAMNGYLDDIRITKGRAEYTANFTPPTEAFPDSEPPRPIKPVPVTGQLAGFQSNIIHYSGV